MTALDPFAYPAENDIAAVAAANSMAEAKELLAGSMRSNPSETGLRDGLAGVGHALLAIASELAALRAEVQVVAGARQEMVQVVAKLGEIREAIDSGLFGLGDVLTSRPRWWQWRRRHALQQAMDKQFSDIAAGRIS